VPARLPWPAYANPQDFQFCEVKGNPLLIWGAEVPAPTQTVHAPALKLKSVRGQGSFDLRE